MTILETVNGEICILIWIVKRRRWRMSWKLIKPEEGKPVVYVGVHAVK